MHSFRQKKNILSAPQPPQPPLRRFHSRAWPYPLCVALAVNMMNVDGAGTSSAKRRRERQLRDAWRHEHLSVAMALAAAQHHSEGGGRGQEGEGELGASAVDSGERHEEEEEEEEEGASSNFSSSWHADPGCLRQGCLFSLRVNIMHVRRLRHARFPGFRRSSGGDSCLRVRDSRILKRLLWWCHEFGGVWVFG